MKNKNLKRKKASARKEPERGKKGFSINEDPFFDTASKRRRKIDDDDDIESSDDESDEFDDEALSGGEGKREEDGEEEEETAAEKRKRVAEAYLEKIRAIAKREEDEDDEERESGEEREREGERDSLVAQILQQEQLEESGRVRRSIASRVQKPETTDGFLGLVKHRQSVTAVALSEDDHRGFSASKDGTIVHWDVDSSGKAEKYLWPSEEVLRSHGAKDPQGRAKKHSKHVLALAVSSDGRYLATGGLDRHIHLWDTRTREHLQAFPGHRGPVSCLTFRLGTSELFSGSFDRTIKIWNVEDRAYINTLFGHQSDVIGIDCLRKERVLTVGRDRAMHLFKVPEESRLVFRAPASSLECCCFINNDEFLSGSDDGSIEHWSVMRKKPVHIVKNAHAISTPYRLDQTNNEGLPNGHVDPTPEENGSRIPGNYCSTAYSWVSSVTVCRSSDLAASGAGNGSVRLWEIDSESKGIRPSFELPLVGFVNSLAFAKSGQFLVAGVGQEPRLGRWGRVPGARNGVAVHSLKLL